MGVHWRVGRAALDDTAVRAAVTAALEHGGRPGIDVEVVLVDEPTLTDLHGRFLDDPTPTDVITFDLEEDGNGPAAELYVSVDRALQVALERGIPAARELALYVVHGTLHLCGFDDHETAERARMRSAERTVLESLGYPPDELPHEA